jgi:phage recombination protein Bet
MNATQANQTKNQAPTNLARQPAAMNGGVPAPAPAAEKMTPAMAIAKDMAISGAQFLALRGILGHSIADHHVAMFLLVCKQKKLDPFSNQIFMTIRKDKGIDKPTFQTSIDGYRTMADRTGKYAGSDEATFELDKDGKPTLARVVVYKLVEGERIPFTGVARWSEFKPDAPNDFMWKKMPFNQLAKCAEAQALRKAFPAETSGIFMQDEAFHREDDVQRAQGNSALALNEALANQNAVDVPSLDVPSVDGQIVKARDEFAKLGMTWEAALTSADIPFTKNGEGRVVTETLTQEHMDNLWAAYEAAKADFEAKVKK